jgi:tocopherol cyclase
MQRYLYETLHPEIYHGYRKQPPYFEGWYYKLISADEQTRYAVIPGVFRGLDRQDDHAFVQVLDGMTGDATYHQYPFEAFWASEEQFDIRVGPNRFTQHGLTLDIDSEGLRLAGSLEFRDGVSWPVSLISPGVMGWYAWIPFMECYHGILSFDHLIYGTLEVNGQPVDLSGGRGYMEKDWGQAFPSGYVWQQTNHFDTPATCLTASIAMIPWLGNTFRGFLVGFYHHRKLYRLTTYTGAIVERLDITDDHVFWTVRDRHYRLEMTSERVAGGLLKAPIRTEMHKRVDETLQATVDVRFSTLDGRTIFAGRGRNAGLEVHGDLDALLNTR